MRMRGKERYARGANNATVHPPTPPPHAAFILLSSSVAVMTTRKGTMNWDPKIHHMLRNSMIVVGLRILRLLVAPPVSMFLTMMIDVLFSFIISVLHCKNKSVDICVFTII